MKSVSTLGALLAVSASVLACAVEASGTDGNGNGGSAGAALNPACKLLSPCCEKWPADLRRSCTGPVEANGDGCKALLSNNAAVATYCPELSVESCSEDLRKILPDQCGGSGPSAGGLATFTPSNIGKLELPSELTDASIEHEGAVCFVNAETGESDCLKGTNKFVAKRVGDYDVLFAKTFSVPKSITVYLTGSRPVVVVATDSIDLQGSITVGFAPQYEVDNDRARPGARTSGTGIGGSFYGGGSFCGVGGIGFDGEGVAGAVYGSDRLVPLEGGSRGAGTKWGKGGGALQLVAGSKIVVDGLINASGQVGDSGGGGSGGAVLIEAPTIAGKGFIAAIGGNGRNNVNANKGGGAGGGMSGADGGDGTYAYSGGGGGAGRIRLNGRNIEFTGEIAPNEGTKCATKGTLADP